jgi:hypothetical protein
MWALLGVAALPTAVSQRVFQAVHPRWPSALQSPNAHAERRATLLRDKPSRVRGRTERDLNQADPNAVVDALHGTPRPRVRGTGKEYRDIVQPNQLMPWKKSDAQRIFLENATAQDLATFRKISERIYSNLRHELDTARIMRELDPRGCGLLTRQDLSKVFHSINLALSPHEFDSLVTRLDRAHSRFDAKAAQNGSARTVSIDFFLLVFDADQR